MRIATSLCVFILWAAAVPAQGQVNVDVLLETVDLGGDPISEIGVGEEFELRVFVDDVRTSTPLTGLSGENLFGVFSAYVQVAFDQNLVSFDSIVVDEFFNDLIPPDNSAIDTRIDTSTPGVIRAGGFSVQIPPPGSDPQLLWSAKLSAEAVGDVTFASFFEDFSDDPENALWLLYGEYDIQFADNVSFSNAELTIVPEPAAIVPFAVGLVVLGAAARRNAGRKAKGKQQKANG